jgi:hypothetical protein
LIVSESQEAIRLRTAAGTEMFIEQEARSLVAVCSRAILVAISLLCGYLLALQIPDWLQQFSLPKILPQILLLMALGLAPAYLAIRGRKSTVKRIACEVAALAVVLFAVEVMTVAWTPNPKDSRAMRQRAAARLGLPFDDRYPSQVVRDLRSNGVDAFPGLGYEWATLPGVREHLPKGLYPLSHASNAVVVACNESGRYFSYRTDEWGFNNPPGLLDAGDIDVALVGESYVLGFCLPASQSLAGRIREKFPRTANFGLAGNRTRGQLASFREFVEPIRPRVVLWAINPTFVVESDSSPDPVLEQYLDPGFSQHLRAQQPYIDGLIRRLAIPVQAELDRSAQETQREARLARYRQAWQLPETRSQLGQVLRLNRQGQADADLGEFVQTLQLVKRTAEEWDGKLMVVLLPIYSEVVADQVRENLRHDRLATLVSSLGIPVVDGVELFKQHPDPAGFYTLRINNHPTAEGYALLSHRILAEIDAQFSGPATEGR